MNSSRQRYNVCSETPACRTICAAGSSLLNKRSTSSIRYSVVNVDFLPIAALRVDISTIAYPVSG